MLTVILIVTILTGFILMTKGILKQEVAMPLVAFIAIILAGEIDGSRALHEGFSEFSRIAILFTAVAVPAHILQRSKVLDWVGMLMGEFIGKIHKKTKTSIKIIIPLSCLVMVYIMAALFHNTTSILISALIIYVICKSYNVKSIPVLAGALVASNLGGFSTRWGDTPNIVESATWNLNHFHFFSEIMPLNIVALLLLVIIISIWLILSSRKDSHKSTRMETTFSIIKFRNARRDMSLDKRLIFIGLMGLVIAIVLPLFFIQYEIIFSCLAIVICVLADYKDHRSETLLALGIETYATLVSIFVLAQVLANSHIGIGKILYSWVAHSNGSVFVITSSAYIGTLFTEAASWASVASPIIHAKDPSHLAAWALGSGIFAGSSSLVTAASAGIILTRETKDNPKDARITFGSYVVFGLSFSLFMLAFYTIVLQTFY